MRRILLSTGLALVSLAALLVLGCGGSSYGGGGGSYGGGGGGSGSGIPSSISVTPGTASASVGGTQQFTAVVKNSSGATLAGVTLNWTSSNTAAASVDQHGLATAVAVGTSNITASTTYMGVVYTSNSAVFSVTLADAVSGTAATGRAMQGALITLQDAAGRSQTGLSDRDGRFLLSTAGLTAPFLLKAEDGRGRVLFGAAARTSCCGPGTAAAARAPRRPSRPTRAGRLRNHLRPWTRASSSSCKMSSRPRTCRTASTS